MMHNMMEQDWARMPYARVSACLARRDAASSMGTFFLFFSFSFVRLPCRLEISGYARTSQEPPKFPIPQPNKAAERHEGKRGALFTFCFFFPGLELSVGVIRQLITVYTF